MDLNIYVTADEIPEKTNKLAFDNLYDALMAVKENLSEMQYIYLEKNEDGDPHYFFPSEWKDSFEDSTHLFKQIIAK